MTGAVCTQFKPPYNTGVAKQVTTADKTRPSRS